MQLLLVGYVSGNATVLECDTERADRHSYYPLDGDTTNARRAVGAGNALAFFIGVHGITIWTDEAGCRLLLMVRQSPQQETDLVIMIKAERSPRTGMLLVGPHAHAVGYFF
jgi:hypothetical protein